MWGGSRQPMQLPARGPRAASRCSPMRSVGPCAPVRTSGRDTLLAVTGPPGLVVEARVPEFGTDGCTSPGCGPYSGLPFTHLEQCRMSLICTSGSDANTGRIVSDSHLQGRKRIHALPFQRSDNPTGAFCSSEAPATDTHQQRSLVEIPGGSTRPYGLTVACQGEWRLVPTKGPVASTAAAAGAGFRRRLAGFGDGTQTVVRLRPSRCSRSRQRVDLLDTQSDNPGLVPDPQHQRSDRFQVQWHLLSPPVNFRVTYGLGR